MVHTRGISDDAIELLREAAKSWNGQIRRLAMQGGTSISTNRRAFPEGRNPKEIARWEYALDELEGVGFVRSTSHKRQMFDVTPPGYRFLDMLCVDQSSSDVLPE